MFQPPEKGKFRAPQNPNALWVCPLLFPPAISRERNYFKDVDCHRCIKWSFLRLTDWQSLSNFCLAQMSGSQAAVVPGPTTVSTVRYLPHLVVSKTENSTLNTMLAFTTFSLLVCEDHTPATLLLRIPEPCYWTAYPMQYWKEAYWFLKASSLCVWHVADQGGRRKNRAIGRAESKAAEQAGSTKSSRLGRRRESEWQRKVQG